MKKKYYAILCLLFCFIADLEAQVIAADDTAYNLNAAYNGNIPNGNFFTSFNVLANDTVDGSLVYQLATVSIISVTDPGITLVNGRIYLAPTTSTGTHTMVYQICRISNPSECDTATVTINVCYQEAPVLTITPPDCSNANGSITLSGLPAGNWTILKRTYFTPFVATTGTGSDYTFNNLAPESYYFRVISSSNCTSADVIASINTPDGMTVDPVGTYQDFNGNGVTDAGDIVNWQIDITNTFSCPLTNIQIVQEWIPTNGGPILSIPGGTTNSQLTAVQVLTQEDILLGEVSLGIWLSADSAAGSQYGKFSGTTSLNIADGIKLNAFLDTDGNGVQNGVEPNFTYGVFHYEHNNDGILHNIDTSDGEFMLYETNPANTFDISFDMYTSCSASYTVSPSSYSNITIVMGSGITTYNFPITVVQCNDLGVYISRRETARPGETYSHWVSYYNTGNQAIASGSITFTCDPAVTVTAVSIPGATVTPTGFTYNFTNLQPLNGDWFYVTMQTPAVPNVNLGDLLTSNISITIPPGDANIANNQMSITEEVTNSYDPNDISESHGPQIVYNDFTTQDELTYMIRFENTGNANAINIRVENILDGKLDPTSVRMLDASHSYVLDRVENNLEWTFSAIGLPPSVSGTEVGKGYILFNVKPKPDYAIGDIIPAQASIYFDTNPAIVTNTFNTEFVASLGTPGFNTDNLVVYPNPVKNMLQISNSENIDSIVVYNVLGQSVLAKSLHATNASIDMTGLGTGVYLLKAYSGNQEKIFRVIKE